MNELAMQDSFSAIEQVVIGGDLSRLTSEQRVAYYRAVCNSIGLNPLTKPFDYLTLNGKLVLYARKDATDQLRSTHRVSIVKLERERMEDVYVVTAYASLPDGRQDSSTGAVNIAGLKGDALANALMKAETKAKRRVTLSICGLGMLDETEIETIPDARRFEERPAKAPVVPPEAPQTAQTAQVDEIAVEIPGMAYEKAKLVTNSQGKLYIDLDTPVLVNMANSITKKLNAHDGTPEETDERQYKLAAIKVILQKRSEANVSVK